MYRPFKGESGGGGWESETEKLRTDKPRARGRPENTTQARRTHPLAPGVPQTWQHLLVHRITHNGIYQSQGYEKCRRIKARLRTNISHEFP